MADFNLSYTNTMINEGGYSNAAADRGGETYMGISRNTFPEWPGWAIIDNYKGNVYPKPFGEVLSDNKMLHDQVKAFYKENFWPASLDRFDQDIANELFDTAVNQGLGTAIRYLQASLNALNRNQKDYPDVKVDGGIGPVTLSCYDSLIATSKYPGRSYNKVVKVLLKLINYFQMKKYLDIIEKDPSQEDFMFGWTERVI